VRVAVTQPNFLPWLGYFDLLDAADLWVSLDNVQLTRRSFVVRNRVRLLDGRQRWLTVALVASSRDVTIAKARLASGDWWRGLWNVIAANYRHCPLYPRYADWLQDLLRPRDDEVVLARYNERIIAELAAELQIRYEFARSSDIAPVLEGSAQEKILTVLSSLPVTQYLNFARGVDVGLYDPTAFAERGIQLLKQDYQHPHYAQGDGEFASHLSVVDALLHLGPRTTPALRTGSRWLLCNPTTTPRPALPHGDERPDRE
jgi:hypothetical protein